MGTIVTSKGQVTIPKAVRDRLGIKPGTEVQFEPTEDGRFLLTTAGRKRSLKKKSLRAPSWNGDRKDEHGRDHGSHAGRKLKP